MPRNHWAKEACPALCCQRKYKGEEAVEFGSAPGGYSTDSYPFSPSNTIFKSILCGLNSIHTFVSKLSSILMR